MNTFSSQRDVLKVFLASPSDLSEERKISRKVVNQVNKNLGRNLGIHVDLIGWEDTLPGYSRPQEKINEDLKKSDLFIGILWKRWGSNTGEYSSGFEEEFELAKELKKEGNLLELSLFFKDIPSEMRQDPGPQLTKVIEFREKITSEKNIMYKSYKDTTSWDLILYNYLTNYLTEGFNAQNNVNSSSSGKNATLLQNATDTDLGEAFQEIVENFNNDESILEISFDKIVRAYFACFTVVHTLKISPDLIGNHELNLLYLYRTKIDLHHEEKLKIIDLLASDKINLKPGWYWINDFEKPKLIESIYHLITFEQKNKLAIGLINFLEAITTKPDLDEVKNVIEISDSSVGNRILDYVGKTADSDAVPLLMNYYKSDDNKIALGAWKAILRIYNREAPDLIVDWISELDVELRNNYLEIISFENLEKKDNRKLLADNDLNLRYKAFQEIKEELSSKELRKLINGSNDNMKSAIFMELARRNELLDVEKVDEQLDDKEFLLQENLHGVKKADDKYFKSEILLEHYKNKTPDELKGNITWFSIDSHSQYEALADKYFNKFKDDLREDIKNQFEGLKNHFYRDLEKNSDISEEKISSYHNHDEFIGNRYLVYAFRALSRNAEQKDLELAIDFLEDPKAGSYSDRIRQACLDIIEDYGSNNLNEKLISILPESNKHVKKKAIDLLIKFNESNHQTILEKLVKQEDSEIIKIIAHNIIFDDLNFNYNWNSLLYRKDKKIRISALAIIVSRSKPTELKEILQEYPSTKHIYYYDVVTWIDKILYAPDGLSEKFRQNLFEETI